MAGKFSCDACGKQYSWKPELAGKRVKCKCGTPIGIPAHDPAGDDVGDLGDLAALSEGAPTTPGAVAGGPTCPGCGSGVDPSAVICVNCGQNLKTGTKLKTSKVAAAAGVADTYAPAYRSYGAVNNDEGMSPKQKKLIIASSIGGLLVIIAGFIVYVLPKSKEANQRQAQINARPAKLEHALTAMEENGGLVGAVRSGALAGGPSGAAAVGMGAAGAGGTGAAAPGGPPPGYEFNERHERLLANEAPRVGRKFILDPKAKFQSQTPEKSKAIVTTMYDMGCKSVMVIGVHQDDYTKDTLATGLVATLPEDKDARTKIFAFYHTLEHTIEPMDMDRQTDVGQKYIAIEFKDPRADGPRGR